MYAQALQCGMFSVQHHITNFQKHLLQHHFRLLIEIFTPWNTQAQQTKEWQTHKNTMSWHLLYQSSIISILRRRCRRTEKRNKWQWGDTNVPLLCSPLSAWENTTDRLSGLTEHKPFWTSLEFCGWGVGCCGLAIHFFPLRFCLGTREAGCLFELS